MESLTVLALLSGLHHYTEANFPRKIKVQSEDGKFGHLHTLPENLFRKLHEQRVRAEKNSCYFKRTTVEKWDPWFTQPRKSLEPRIRYNGLNFTMRGGEEHRSLTLSQKCSRSK